MKPLAYLRNYIDDLLQVTGIYIGTTILHKAMDLFIIRMTRIWFLRRHWMENTTMDIWLILHQPCTKPSL